MGIALGLTTALWGQNPAIPETTPDPASLFVPIQPSRSASTPPSAFALPTQPIMGRPAAITPQVAPATTVSNAAVPPAGIQTQQPQVQSRPAPANADLLPSDTDLLLDQTPSPSMETLPPPTPEARAQQPIAYSPVPVATPIRTATVQPTPRKTTTTQTAPRTPTAEKSANQGVSQGQIAKLVQQANSSQKANDATQVGWAYYNNKDYSSSSFWFEQAMEWDPNSSDGAYGLALSKLRGGDLTSAESIAGYRSSQNPKMRALLGDIYVQRGLDSYQSRNYVRSLQQFEQARQYRPLTNGELSIMGWDYLNLNKNAEAADIFEKLYRANRDRQSAEGLYTALSRLGDYQRIERIAMQAPGPLKQIYVSYPAKAYYKAGLYRAAYDVGGEKIYPALANITSPSIAMGFSYRNKSGQTGESQLQTIRVAAFEAKVYAGNRAELTAKLSFINLNAGTLGVGANFGNAPKTFKNYTTSPVTKYNGLGEFSLRFEYQNWLSPFVEVGVTPIGATLTAKPTGRIGATYRHTSGYVTIEGYARSIQESITSYVGSVDPYKGAQWGAVQELGVGGQVFQGLGQGWTIYGAASYGSIQGTNTEENTHLAVVGAVAKEIKVDGLEYLTIGPAVSYESFDNNQNFFTYGNGGYFSPQSILQGVLSVNFLTKEGEMFLLGGDISIGYQGNEQASAPYFPINNPGDGRKYPATSSQGAVALIGLQGGYLIDNHWMIGASASYAVTANYNEGFISIYGRYFFEGRAGLFRSDLGFLSK